MRLTTAQALVRWMIAQRCELLDGTEVPLFAGVFAIFGHGNVLGLGTALAEVRDVLPVWRGQTEQGMAHAAIGYARATDRRQVMAATSSIGPGALNMVTAAGLAHANRLPVLLLPADTFVGRASDPVLQQVEHFGDATVSVNDAFRAVSRYFDRITRPEQLIATLPQVAGVLTDPAEAGPVVLALPQDVQAEVVDFPDAMLTPRLHRVPRPRPDRAALADAAAVVRACRRPLLIVGGGARYSGAGAAVLDFATTHRVPVTETPAGRTLLPDPHPLHAGGIGIIGAASANALAADADLVLAVGTRLSDFTTGSWRLFAADMRLVSINAARFDAVKHAGHALVGDARECLRELSAALVDWQADPDWAARAATERAAWDAHIDALRAGAAPGDTADAAEAMLSYAQVVGVVNDASGAADYVLAASGGIPGELDGGWRAGPAHHGPTMDLEYGFSCMGYELSGPWGAAMARARSHPDGLVTTILGDGSYLMLNSELFSAAFTGHPFVAVVCDNDGYAVIHRLQTAQGAAGFHNLFTDCAGPGAGAGRSDRRDEAAQPDSRTGAVRVDFAAHARALGCAAFDGGASIQTLRTGYAAAREAARDTSRPAVVVCRVSPTAWTQSGAWWELGVPPSLAGHADQRQHKAHQLRWLS